MSVAGWLWQEQIMHTEDIWTKPCYAKSVSDKIQKKLKLFKQFSKGGVLIRRLKLGNKKKNLL